VAAIGGRVEAGRRWRRVMARMTRAAWRLKLEQAEKEREWALIFARAGRGAGRRGLRDPGLRPG
jgi:hypothetical protein